MSSAAEYFAGLGYRPSGPSVNIADYMLDTVIQAPPEEATRMVIEFKGCASLWRAVKLHARYRHELREIVRDEIAKAAHGLPASVRYRPKTEGIREHWHLLARDHRRRTDG